MSQNVLITGAGRGLGLAIAERLCEQGYRVIGLSRTKSAEFDALAERVGDRLSFISYDLADIGGIADLMTQVTKEHGALYGLVNNAGIGADGVLATMHATEIERVLQVNLTAAITLTKFACRSMLVQKSGRIVNISSIIARTGFSGLSVYAATKAGLEGFTRSLARELGRAQITVNCVAPGYMQTEMTQGLDEEQLETIRRRSPLGLARVQDVAGAVTYLLGPDAVRVTGTVLTVDGGSTA